MFDVSVLQETTTTVVHAEPAVSTLSPAAAVMVGGIVGVIAFGLATARQRRER